jgi:hypothetical protein
MTSYPETLTVKKLIKMEFFIIKIYYISSSKDDPNITHTKNNIWMTHTLHIQKITVNVFTSVPKPRSNEMRVHESWHTYISWSLWRQRHLAWWILHEVLVLPEPVVLESRNDFLNMKSSWPMQSIFLSAWNWTSKILTSASRIRDSSCLVVIGVLSWDWCFWRKFK